MGKKLNGPLIEDIRWTKLHMTQEELAAYSMNFKHGEFKFSDKWLRIAEAGEEVGYHFLRLAEVLGVEPADQLFVEKGLTLKQVRFVGQSDDLVVTEYKQAVHESWLAEWDPQLTPNAYVQASQTQAELRRRKYRIEDRKWLEAAIAPAIPEQRTVLHLVRNESLDCEKFAQTIGRNENTVKQWCRDIEEMVRAYYWIKDMPPSYLQNRGDMSLSNYTQPAADDPLKDLRGIIDDWSLAAALAEIVADAENS